MSPLSRRTRNLKTEAKSKKPQPDTPTLEAPAREKRKPGPHRTPQTLGERALAAIDSASAARRKRISGKDRAWLAFYVQNGFSDPEKAAQAAGFRERGIGYKIVERLADLVDAERLRLAASEQMEMEEALRVIAQIARDRTDRKVQLAAATTIVRVHGGLSDKPLAPSDRLSLKRQIEDLAGHVKSALGKARPGSKTRVEAALRVTVEDDPHTKPHAEPLQEPYKNADSGANMTLDIEPENATSRRR